jgi:hypothetical protein
MSLPGYSTTRIGVESFEAAEESEDEFADEEQAASMDASTAADAMHQPRRRRRDDVT